MINKAILETMIDEALRYYNISNGTFLVNKIRYKRGDRAEMIMGHLIMMIYK